LIILISNPSSWILIGRSILKKIELTVGTQINLPLLPNGTQQGWPLHNLP